MRFTVERLESRRLLSQGPIPTVPTPAAHWALDEGQGKTAVDSSGNNHNATLGTGVTWVAGNVGTRAISLNGTAAEVVTATGPVVDTSVSFTASTWVDLSSLSGYQTAFSVAGTNVAGFFLGLRGDSGTFAFTRLASDSTSAATTVVAAPTAPTTGTWYHLVGVDDATAGTMTLYVDGQSVGSSAYTGGWAAGGDTLIGHGFYGGAQVDYVNGSIDDVQIFSSALSAAQVTALDQPAAYTFDEGTGTTAADTSGHGKTLTLQSGASWAAGRIGSNSLTVNGTATGIATNASAVVNTAQSFSVSAWVYLNSTSGTQTFVSIDGKNVSEFELQFRTDTGEFAFTRAAFDSSTATVTHADATSAPVTGTWYNLIGVDNVAAGQLQLYVNGVLQSTAAYTTAWQATGTLTTVVGGGKAAGARADFANGDIDDVHFYNSPLTTSAASYFGTGGSSTITVSAGSSGVTVSPNLFGAFMEDINYGGEGGIYNDEVRNSGFNDSTNPLDAWAAVADSGVTDALTSDTTTGPTTALTQSGALNISSGVSATARAGISNAGYFGVAVAPSTSYTVQFYAKATANFTGPLTVDLESTSGVIYATATIPAVTTAWTEYTATLTTGTNTPVTSTNRFVISTTSASANGSTIWFGATYLFPPAYENQANHLRIDLMQELAALKPAVFRVPGGNYLEGNTYATRFEWSNTVGPIQDRPGHYNSAWGYWSTDGMGLDEYLQMAEEIGAAPILAVYAGYTLNGASDTGATLTADVTDAVNEIHYVLDPATTVWGAERAANGHPAPYDVSQIEVGNEDFFSSTYSTRYPLFYGAIHSAFPSLKIIATSTSTGGAHYDTVDDHFYNSPQWFEANSNYFDNVARTGSTVFVGEWAANSGAPTNNMVSALGDAAWLLGLERNSDLVTEESYAPLWVNVNSYQWSPDLIGFNATSSYGSPSYWAQVMLANNHGTTVVSDTVSGATGLQTLVTKTGTTYYVTVVNTVGSANPAAINLTGVTSVGSTGSAVGLVGGTTVATNSITSPTNIVPVTSGLTGLGANFSYTFPGYSITVLQFTATVDTPTVQTAAAASPSPVTGTTANLSVLGADVSGESNLTYTWAATGPAPVTFSANGTNAAKNSVATFTAAGSYTFVTTITNAPVGTTATSTVAVVVNQTLTSMAITPSATTVAAGSSVQFVAGPVDQFGSSISSSAVIWSIASGGGAITSAGLYTAPAVAGPATIRATFSGGSTATSTVTIAAPLAFYQADSSTGSTLVDSSGNGNNGLLNGAAGFSTGVEGNALALSGGYVSLPGGLVSAVTNFTVSAWVNVSTLANWERVFDFGTGTTDYMFLTPDAGGTNAIRFAITTNGGSGEQVLNGPAVVASKWTHIAVTLAGSTGTLYVNGIAVATNTSMTLNPSNLSTTTQNDLGKSQFTADPAFSGSIDDFRIYTVALSAQQVALLALPGIVTPAAASPLSASGATVNLSVLANDVTAGESAVTYTWTTTGTPPGGVAFGVNGTNVAKNTTATFTTPGMYKFTVTVVNPIVGLPTTSSVTVAVVPTIFTGLAGGDTYAIRISPTDPTIEQIFVNTPETSTPTYSIALSHLTLLTFAPTGGDGTLTVDFSNGNPLPAGGISYTGGANPTSTGNALYIAGNLAGSSAFSIDGSRVIPASSTSAVITCAALQKIEFDLLGGSNLLTQIAQAAAPVTYNAGSGANTLTVNGGAFTFNGDPQLGSGNLTVNDNAAVIFNAPPTGGGIQPIHLAALNIGTGATAVLASAAGATDRSVLVANLLTISPNGRLDLGRNDADVITENLAAVRGALASGYSYGAWTGFGIVSSAAGVTSQLTTLGAIANQTSSGSRIYGSGSTLGLFDGLNPSAADVLIRYTYQGDANLDGKVDGSDYSLIDAGYQATLAGWINGDFNYDGVVDGSDYTLIDNAFNNQKAPLVKMSAVAAAQVVTAVPAAVVSPQTARPSPVFGDERSVVRFYPVEREKILTADVKSATSATEVSTRSAVVVTPNYFLVEKRLKKQKRDENLQIPLDLP